MKKKLAYVWRLIATLLTVASITVVLLTACNYEHEHKFTDYVSDNNATCTADGTKTAKCDGCDFTDTVPDSGSSGHKLGDWIEKIPESCLAEGTKGHYTCSVCNKNFDENKVEIDEIKIDKSAHVWLAATCTAPKTCSVCNEIEGAELGHNWTAATCTAPKTCSVCNETEGTELGHNWTAATCTAPKTCSVCNETEGAELGHNWTVATCTAPKTCSVCNETEGAELGHNWTAATCTAPKTCLVCNETEGAELGHNWTAATCTAPKTCLVCNETEGAELGHNWTAATCTAPKTCSVCNETEGTELGHNWTAATCTAPKTCSVCNETEGAELGHNWTVATCTAPKTCSVCNETEGAELGHNWTAATCTAPKTCLVCNETEGAELGHNWTAATCTAPKTCSVCNETEGTELGHNWTAATCTAPKTCSVCNETEGAELGHNWTAATCTAPKTCLVCNETEGTELGHNWTAATCTAPKTCLVCNETEGTELGHNWTAATCTAPKTCSVCNETEGEALGHSYQNYISNNDATCTQDGTKTGTCIHCDDEDTVVDLGSAGHTYTEWIEEVPVSCTQNGTKAHYGCLACDKTFDAEYSEIADIVILGGHTEIIDEAVEPTCTDGGLTEGKHCSVCGERLVDQEELSPVGHTEVIDVEVLPKCTETGLTEGKHCSVCGEVLVPQMEVEALGHDEVSDITLDPTCTTEGTKTISCSRCDYSRVEKINALGHLPGTAADCENAEICARENCDAVLNPAHGHNYETTVTNPTCEDKGYTIYECSRCDDSYIADYKDAKGHSLVDSDFLVATPEVENGNGCTVIKTYTVKCPECEKDVSKAFESKEHTYVAKIKTDATCSADGTKIYTCSVCSDSYEEAYSDAEAHAWVESGTSGKIQKTCSICEEVRTSIVSEGNSGTVSSDDLQEADDLKLSDATISLDSGVKEQLKDGGNTEIKVAPLGDTEKENALLNAGLTQDQIANLGTVYDFSITNENGAVSEFDGFITVKLPYTLQEGDDVNNIAVYYIADDGALEIFKATYSNGYVTFVTDHFSKYVPTKLTPEETCEKFGHETEIQTTLPTCKADGYTVTVCKRCGAETDKTIIAKLPHEYSVSASESASCTSHGYVTYTCVCDDTYTETKSALGHDYKVAESVAASCENYGYTLYSCSICKNEYKETVPQLEHDYTESIIEAECTSEGSIVNTCKACGVVHTTVIPAKGHKYFVTSTESPTCTKQGYSVYECENCQASYKGDFTAAMGHSYSVINIVAPTCVAQGYTVYECKTCGNTYKGALTSAMGHDYTNIVTAPTCVSVGYTTHICEGCNHSYVDKYVEALGHNWTNVITAPTCIDKGYTTHTCDGCGESYVDEYTAALGHNWVDATCAEPKTCIVCNATDGSALGHTWIAATCTTPKTCAVCKVIEDSVFGHTWTNVITAPTCKDGGYTTHTCDGCGESYVDEYTAALGHNWVDATCTEPKTCTICKATDGEVLEHNFNGIIFDINKVYTNEEIIEIFGEDLEGLQISGHYPEDCSKIGFGVLNCSNCDIAFIISFAGAHNMETYEVIEPTCNEAGYIIYRCVNCGYETRETVIAEGHIMQVVESVQPTCTEEGYIKYSCICGEKTNVEQIPAFGHAFGEVKINQENGQTVSVTLPCVREGCGEETIYSCVECRVNSSETLWPTCMETGYITYEILVTAESTEWVKLPVIYLPKAHHNYQGMPLNVDMVYTINEIREIFGDELEGFQFAENYPEDCSKTGFGVTTCSDCGISNIIKVIGNHNIEISEMVESTCDDEGWFTKKCSYCDFEVTEITSPIGHNFINGICENCGEVDIEQSRFALLEFMASEWNRVSENATAEDATMYEEYLMRIKAVTSLEELEALRTEIEEFIHYLEELPYKCEHVLTFVEGTEPTCTENGVLTYICDKCVEVIYEYTPAYGHSFNTDGTCDVCGELDMEAFKVALLDAMSETWVHLCEYASAEDEARYEAYRNSIAEAQSMEELQAYIAEIEEFFNGLIPRCEHTSTYERTTEATCTEDGSIQVLCNECNQLLTEQTIPAKGHNYSEDGVCGNCGMKEGEEPPVECTHELWMAGTVPATCETEGRTTAMCASCGYTTITVIPATGHKINEEGICENCGVSEDQLNCEHKYETHTVDATCISVGHINYVCLECGYERTEPIPAYGHSFREEDGICDRCGLMSDESQDVETARQNALNQIEKHWSMVDEKIAAENEKNLDKYRSMIMKAVTCEEIEDYLTQAIKFIDSLIESSAVCEHTSTYENTIPANCMSVGVVETICSDCELIISVVYTSVADHNFGEEGYCDFCGLSEEQANCEHKYESKTVDATCTSEGFITRTCVLCKYEVYENIQMTDHAFDENGVCVYCGLMSDESQDIEKLREEALNQIEKHWSMVDETVAAENEKQFSRYRSMIMKAVTCEEIEDYLNQATKFIDDLIKGSEVCEHTSTYENTIPANCMSVGVVETICSDCELIISVVETPVADHNFSEEGYCDFCGLSEEQANCEHKYESKTVDATCTSEGFITRTCVLCKYEVYENIQMTDHAFDENGVCVYCGLMSDESQDVEKLREEALNQIEKHWSMVDETVAAENEKQFSRYRSMIMKAGNAEEIASYLAEAEEFINGLLEATPECEHISTYENRVAATCSKEGFIDIICSDCGLIISNEIISVSEHIFDENGECEFCRMTEEQISCEHEYDIHREEPTCDQEGFTDHNCMICGYSIREAIPPIGHNHYGIAFDGKNEYTMSELYEIFGCELEGLLFMGSTPENCTVFANASTSCTDCGSMILLSIIGDHNMEEAKRLQPTCTKDGYVLYICSNCEYQTREIIPAQGHIASEIERIDPACNSEGYVTYSCYCGKENYTEALAPLEHDFIFDADNTYLTLVEGKENAYQGTLVFICNMGCGETRAIESNDIIEFYTDATCSEDGMHYYIYYYTDSETGELLSGTVILETIFAAHTLNGIRIENGAVIEMIPGIELMGSAPVDCIAFVNGFYTCEVCEKNQFVEVRGEHSLKESYRTEASCEKGGMIVYSCPCGAKGLYEMIPSLGGHNFGDDNTCINCGIQNSEAPTECKHLNTDEEHRDPTCTTPGVIEQVCISCGKIISETSVPVIDHVLDESGACIMCGKQQ